MSNPSHRRSKYNYTTARTYDQQYFRLEYCSIEQYFLFVVWQTFLILKAITTIYQKQLQSNFQGNVDESLVYKIPYRRARAWPSARASKGILHTNESPCPLKLAHK